jgi:hypothetical protein
MNKAERELLDKLDELVINASGDELKKIQELDLETQLNDNSFYEAYLDSTALVNQSIRKESNDSK